jgi:hypothetical protein
VLAATLITRQALNSGKAAHNNSVDSRRVNCEAMQSKSGKLPSEINLLRN